MAPVRRQCRNGAKGRLDHAARCRVRSNADVMFVRTTVQYRFRGESRQYSALILHDSHSSAYYLVRHTIRLWNLAIIVRRQPCDLERKLLGHVNAHEELLYHIGIAVGITEDDVHYLARPTQR